MAQTMTIEQAQCILARDNGPYIGLYATPAGKVLTGAVWKDNNRCMEEWEEIKNNNEINWI